MKYQNMYSGIIKRLKTPQKINDTYVKNRTKQQHGIDAYTIEYSWGLCGQKVNKLDLNDLSKDSFRKLPFDENTTFSKEQQVKFNPTLLLEKGKKFGLGLDKLHDVGLNGEGINIAILDWTFDQNNQEMIDEQGNSKIVLYDDSAIDKKYKDDDGFHGKTVSSLLLGSTVGVAPKSKLYYFAINQIREDLETCDILEKIKSLNDQGANIQLISMSSCFNDRQINDNYTNTLHQQHCELITSQNFWKQGFNYMCRNNYEDIENSNNFEIAFSAKINIPEQQVTNELNQLKSDYTKIDEELHRLSLNLENSSNTDNSELLNQIQALKKRQSRIKPFLETTYQDWIVDKEKTEKESIYIPCGGRTYPQIGNDNKYMYCGHGSASWTIPQVSGLFAISRQMDPNLTFEDFANICKNTATKNNKGYLVINPECMVREIHSRNEIKSQNDPEYKKICSTSQNYISKLNAIENISLQESLQDMVIKNDEYSAQPVKKQKESDLIR